MDGKVVDDGYVIEVKASFGKRGLWIVYITLRSSQTQVAMSCLLLIPISSVNNVASLQRSMLALRKHMA